MQIMAISGLDGAASRAQVAGRATGPTSEAGRKIVSHNAIRHGLSGSGMLLPVEEARAAELNEHALTIELSPSGALENMFIKQMAVYQVKAEQAAAMQIELRAGLAEKSKFFWTDERTTIPYDIWVIAILAFVWLTPPDWLGDPMAHGMGLLGFLFR